MPFDAGSITGQLGIDTSGFSASLQGAEGASAGFAGGFGSSVQGAEGIAAGFPTMIGELMVEPLLKLGEIALETGRKVAEAFAEMIPHVANTAAEMSLLAEKSGLSIEFLSRTAAVGQNLGVSLESLESGFKFLQRSAVDAVEGVKQPAEAFKKIGLTADFLNENLGDTQAIFEAVHAGLQRLPDQAERTRASMSLLGRGGSELVPIFNLSREEMEKFADTAEDLGAIEDEESARGGRAWKSMTAQIDQAIEGIEKAVAEPVMQFLADHSEEVGAVINDVAGIIRSAIPLALQVVVEAIKISIPPFQAFLTLLQQFLKITDFVGITSHASEAVGDINKKISEAVSDFSGAAGGGNQIKVDVHTHFDTSTASSEVAAKIHPKLKKALDEQTLEYKSAAQHGAVAKAVGGRRK